MVIDIATVTLLHTLIQINRLLQPVTSTNIVTHTATDTHVVTDIATVTLLHTLIQINRLLQPATSTNIITHTATDTHIVTDIATVTYTDTDKQTVTASHFNKHYYTYC